MENILLLKERKRLYHGYEYLLKLRLSKGFVVNHTVPEFFLEVLFEHLIENSDFGHFFLVSPGNRKVSLKIAIISCSEWMC